MQRGIVYVGGAGRHLMDQSAALVADRIARSLQDKLRDEQPFSYRIRVETDAHCLAPDIGLDIASIEVAKGDAWEPALDILEVKYLPRFARRFERLPPLARAMKAFWLGIRSVIKSAGARRAARKTEANQRQGALNRLDRIQALWLTLMTMATIGLPVYWLLVGAAAVLGVPAVLSVSFDDILGVFQAGRTAEAKSVWTMIVIAVFLVLAVALRKTFIESLDRLAVESFVAMEYQLDDRHYLAAPNAILDAIDFATKRGYGTIDLLSLSLGAVLSTDAIFPRSTPGRAREQVWSPPLSIENWITLGFPYDLIRQSRPDYFDGRQEPVVDFRRWINVVVQDDFLGTTFTKDDGRGIRVSGCLYARAPDVNPTFEPEMRVRPGPQDWFVPLRRAFNHRIYWDDEDARAPTCFAAFVDANAAGWTTEILAVIGKT